MPSPFPGMDPYIEFAGSWTDFHSDLLVGLREQINQRLPNHYVARIEERLEILDHASERKAIVIPDAIVATQSGARERTSATTSVATLEPHVVPQEGEWLDEPMQGFLQIVQFPEERVVTCVELLSPSNKSGPGRQVYLAKRHELLHQALNLVEIDLLLGGDRFSLLAPLPAGDLFAFVSRAETRRSCDVYSWSLRDPLPVIPIPLLSGDGDIPLDLAAAFAQTYARGRYERLLSYGPPPPSLSKEDRLWVIERLSAMPR
jgi:hypothetical protein